MTGRFEEEGDVPIVASGGRRHADDGSVEVELSQSWVTKPMHRLELGGFGLGNGDLLIVGGFLDLRNHVEQPGTLLDKKPR